MSIIETFIILRVNFFGKEFFGDKEKCLHVKMKQEM